MSDTRASPQGERSEPQRWAHGSSWVDVHENWLSTKEAARLLREAQRMTAWEQREIVLFGRSVMQPRLICWFGTAPYRYSGLTLEPRPVPRWIAGVLRRASDSAKVELNHVLCNRYRDGSDGMGMHADDERELGPHPVVATLSLGAPRRFVVKPRGGGPGLRVELSAGTLVVMGGLSQRELVHGLPKTRRAVGERISLTFRSVSF